MEQEILKLAIEKGFLLDNDMLNFFQELKDTKATSQILERIRMISGGITIWPRTGN